MKMKVKWTDKQLDAIMHENNENILVSAGAGSGKTAILSERVIRKLKDGVNINEMLILTFTKAASEEMKDRIRKKIIENKLYDQLTLLDSSYITTFDSYALSIVKKYHYLLGLDKNISLTDETILNIERSKIIDKILEQEYIDKNEDFILLVKTLLKKDDISLKEGIESLLEKIDLEIDANKYLEELNNLDYEEEFNDSYKIYFNNVIEIKNKIEDTLSVMESLIESNSDEEYVEKCSNYYSTLVASKNYNEIKNALDNKERLYLPKKDINEDIINLKKEITLLVNKLKEIVIYDNEKFIKNCYLSSGSLAKTVLRIVEKIYREYSEFKLNNQMFSFMDIAKLAIKIFDTYNDIKEELKESLNEIMIDEYQDTSNMQETFISYISNNNLYMVGDIKQSIYRFRYANPKLFKDKYFNYKEHKGGYLIDLNTNFRSRKEVLENINEIFSSIMNKDLGGADYKQDHLIEYGNKNFLEDNISNQDNNLLVYNYDKKEYNGVTNSEIEAFIVAKDIRDKIDNKYLVFDKDNHNREISYGDFTILVDKRSDFNTYRKILEYFKIPVSLYQNENIIDNDDLYCFNSALLLIKGYVSKVYDKEFVHAFYSLAKSYLFSLSDHDILEIIASSDYENTIIYKKFNNILNNMNSMSIYDLFKSIIFDLDWYNKLIIKGDAKSSEARLAYLLNLANNLDDLSYSFDDVITYFKNINEKELEIVLPNKNSNENSVKVMTIHNSKGLEFPICYFIGFSNSFNTDEIKDNYILNNGKLIMPFIENNTKYPNIDFFKYKKEFLKEEVGEKIRLLYVALTRAKEKMIMVVENSDTISDLYDSKSFNEFINYIKDQLYNYKIDVSSNEININPNYKLYVANKNIDYDLKDFEYTLLNNSIEEVETQKFSKEVNLKDTNKELLSIGNYLHNLLFKLDFKNPYLDNLDIKTKNIVNKFLKMEFLNIDTAINIYKEYEFVNDNKNGIIDLIIEYDNEVKIIDYKLSNIEDEEYVNQLKGYKDYLIKITNKPIKLYLYSLLKGEYKIIE